MVRDIFHAPAIAAIAVMLLAIMPARAAGWEVGGGYADQIDGEASWLATVAWVSPAQKFPWEVMLGYIDGRDGANPGSRADQEFLALSKRWNLSANFFLGFGVAANSNDNDVLSGHAQFLSSLGWRYDRYSLTLRHISNASIEGQNRGETFVHFSVGF